MKIIRTPAFAISLNQKFISKLKEIIFFICLFGLSLFSQVHGQSYYTEVGGSSTIELPDYITKMNDFDTSGSVIIVFENVKKHVQGSVSEIFGDTSKITLSTFYESSKSRLLENETTKMLSSPHYFKKNEYEYIEAEAKDISAVDDSSNGVQHIRDRYFYLCVIKYNTFFYRIICFSPMKDSKVFKPVFQRIALSLTHYYYQL